MFNAIKGGVKTAVSKVETSEARQQTGNQILGGITDSAVFMAKTGGEVTMSLYEESIQIKDKIK